MTVLSSWLLPPLPDPKPTWPTSVLIVGTHEPKWLAQVREHEALTNTVIRQAHEPPPAQDPYAKADDYLLRNERQLSRSWSDIDPLDGLPSGAVLAIDTRLDASPMRLAVPILTLRLGDRGLDAMSAWYAGASTLDVELELTQPDGSSTSKYLTRLAVVSTSWGRTRRRISDVLDRWWIRVLLAGPPQGLTECAPLRRDVSSWSNVLLRTALHVMARKLEFKLVGIAWRVGVRRRNPTAALTDLTSFHWVDTPRGAFDADPFVVSDGSRQWLFFERMPAGQARGEIWVAELDSDGRPGPARLALRASHHLAFPQVVRADGQWWMLPDSGDADGIQVFRANAFPFEWSLVDTWLPGQTWVDPILFQVDSRWWLTATPREPSNSELFAYWSDSWGGPWNPHPLNPVVSDVRCARNAGRVIVRDSTLTRVAQDCGDSYGGAIVLRTINALSPDAWSESTVRRIAPPSLAAWNGIHTWTQTEEVEAIDVHFRVPWR